MYVYTVCIYIYIYIIIYFYNIKNTLEIYRKVWEYPEIYRKSRKCVCKGCKQIETKRNILKTCKYNFLAENLKLFGCAWHLQLIKGM